MISTLLSTQLYLIKSESEVQYPWEPCSCPYSSSNWQNPARLSSEIAQLSRSAVATAQLRLPNPPWDWGARCRHVGAAWSALAGCSDWASAGRSPPDWPTGRGSGAGAGSADRRRSSWRATCCCHIPWRACRLAASRRSSACRAKRRSGGHIPRARPARCSEYLAEIRTITVGIHPINIQYSLAWEGTKWQRSRRITHSHSSSCILKFWIRGHNSHFTSLHRNGL